ncbi:hypothetical protein [Nocardioides aequoreus]|uniref:hypothetical protein n=1 Tax=Nocardioides aequoreus TaxID=397278 RepID=UPI0004C335C9|nr:hypothetical protein [Nocardioides aequoreus]
MTSRVLTDLAVAAVMTAVVALLSGAGWAGWLIGAVYALALAVGVWVSSAPRLADWTLRPSSYAAAAAVALVVGTSAWWLTGADNASWWGVGVVLGIALSAGTTASARR